MQHKPECFASPSAHSTASPVCQKCAVQADCAAAGTIMLTKIRAAIGWSEKIAPVRAPMIPRVKLDKIEVDTSDLAALPKKSQALVVGVRSKGVDLSVIRAGQNPFEKVSPKFLGVIAGQLLDGGFTKAELKALFIRTFTWSDGTASAHVSLALPALTHLGLIAEVAGRFKIKE